jgi:hypothetical protein
MYSQDQFLISSGDAPVFGRSGAGDHIETAATTSVCDNSSCGNATFNGTQDTGIDVPEPSDNAGLATDAANHGKVYTGTTTITLSGTTATITNCPSTCTTYNNVSLGTYPIIYVQNGSSCSPPAYTPFGPSYTTTGCAGDVYVQGSYSTSVTIAAANNIIVTGNITTSSSGGSLTGNAVLGLVANQFVRVQHDVPTRPSNSSGSCPSSADTTDLNNLTIDAAILALSHSFIVDNYDCGYPASTSAPLGTLTVNGSIVQKFRGTVGARYAVSNNGTWTTYMTGYLKNYTYDDRLKSLTPPYLFDIFTAGWNLSRENLCVTSGGSAQSAC